MTSRLAQRRSEGGFTLIELLIVMIIIAILLSIAIPIFLGQRQKAQGTKAKSHLSTVQKTLEACAASTVDQSYKFPATTTLGANCAASGYIYAEEPSLGGTNPLYNNTSCSLAGVKGKVCAVIDATNMGYTIYSATDTVPHMTFVMTKTAAGTPTKTCGGDATMIAKLCPGGQW